jgi:flagellar motor protein MotB
MMDNLAKDTEIDYDYSGLKIEFRDSLMFASGSSNFITANNEGIMKALRVIAKVKGDYTMTIEGHSDDVQPKTLSNWELSASRGFAVMRLIKGMGVDEKNLRVMAYAHTKPKHDYMKLKGKALALARAANRRVVIHIE